MWSEGLRWGDVGDMAETVRDLRAVSDRLFAEGRHAPAEAPDFPRQPSRKDGLGTMCTEHWRAYVKTLREARVAVKAAAAGKADSGSEEADSA